VRLFAALFVLGLAGPLLAGDDLRAGTAMADGHTGTEAAVPVGQEPLHKGVLKNDYVEVVHLTLPAGQSTMLHTHSHDGVAVRLSKAMVRIDVPGQAPTAPGVAEPGSVSAQAYAQHPMTHRVSNVGTTPFAVIDIEFLKRPEGPTTSPLFPPAAENDSARVYKWALGPGASTPEHTHERPYVVIAATPMQLAMKAPDGRSMEHAVAAGDVHWVPGKVTHVLSNQGNEAGVIVEVELK
jgi:quercetin dioxygenase-like cupin family protein